MCGDPDEGLVQQDGQEISQTLPVQNVQRSQQYPGASMAGPSTQRGWSLPRPWASDGRVSFSIPSQSRKSIPQYEPLMKRSFLLVTLILDHKRNISIESTISNVYVKIAESSASVQTILSEIGKKALYQLRRVSDS